MQVGHLTAGLALRGRHSTDKRKARTGLKSAGSLSAPTGLSLLNLWISMVMKGFGPASQFCDVSSLSAWELTLGCAANSARQWADLSYRRWWSERKHCRRFGVGLDREGYCQRKLNGNTFAFCRADLVILAYFELASTRLMPALR